MLVPIYILVLQFSPRHAIPLSNITVFGGAVANTLLNVPKRHPLADRPLVDWDLILVMEPLSTCVSWCVCGGARVAVRVCRVCVCVCRGLVELARVPGWLPLLLVASLCVFLTVFPLFVSHTCHTQRLPEHS